MKRIKGEIITMVRPDKFRFRKLDNIGAADAQEDQFFLQNCFVDTGDLEVLRKCSDPRRLVLGRTGSGKTALLLKLAEYEDNVIEIKPESLALAYISNSTILGFFTEIGVNLDIFYKLLWRHIFTVEILKKHFQIVDEQAKVSFVKKIQNIIKGDKHRKALEYLEKWGKTFWQETEYRIKEVTNKLETDLKAEVGAAFPMTSYKIEDACKLSEEQKVEVIKRAQHVVNEVQIRQLSDILDLIAEVLTDKQRRYYITIDRLDEEWVEDKLRLKLIRALIETVRDFKKVSQAKIIVALRLDLVERVFNLTRSAGFQEEKYESLFLDLHWDNTQLINILDSRIDFMIKQRYTSQKVSHKDILPGKIMKKPTVNYIIDRTLMRPRDIIQFFNYCIDHATDQALITSKILKSAEGEYSRARMRSLSDEWFSDYPNLYYFTVILKHRKKSFKANEITVKELEDLCLNFVIENEGRLNGPLADSAKQVSDCIVAPEDFRKSVLHIFYRVGLVRLKTESHESAWGIDRKRSIIPKTDITENTKIYIHPMFWRVLGIKDD